MGYENQIHPPKLTERFKDFFKHSGTIRELGFTFSEIRILNLYLDYLRLNNSLEVLPKAPDGSYYYEHIRSISEIVKIREDVEREKKMAEAGIDEDDKPKEERVKQQNNEQSKEKKKKIDQSELLIPAGQVITPTDPSKVIKPEKDRKAKYDKTARETTEDASTTKPFYEVDFRFPEKNKNVYSKQPARKIYHSNEMSFTELAAIAEEQRLHPKKFISKGQRIQERRDRKPSRQIEDNSSENTT